MPTRTTINHLEEVNVVADNHTYIDNPNDPDYLTSATDFSAPGNLDDDVLVDNVEPTVGADDGVLDAAGSLPREPDYTGRDAEEHESDSEAVSPAKAADNATWDGV